LSSKCDQKYRIEPKTQRIGLLSAVSDFSISAKKRNNELYPAKFSISLPNLHANSLGYKDERYSAKYTIIDIFNADLTQKYSLPAIVVLKNLIQTSSSSKNDGPRLPSIPPLSGIVWKSLPGRCMFVTHFLT
jgi:hypothetical protein